MTDWSAATEGRTRGRVCKWYDDHGEVVAMSLDVWDENHELMTTMVAELGPFDHDQDIEATMVKCLTAQQVLF